MARNLCVTKMSNREHHMHYFKRHFYGKNANLKEKEVPEFPLRLHLVLIDVRW
jgi:hypothetical protein